jgi:hypothetical protein
MVKGSADALKSSRPSRNWLAAVGVGCSAALIGRMQHPSMATVSLGETTVDGLLWVFRGEKDVMQAT